MRLLLALVAASLLGSPADRYASVVVNADGSVTVTTEDGRHVTPNRLAPIATNMRNVGAEKAAVAPDHRSVGWVALFENCCTSYPIPVALAVLTNSRLLTLSPTEPIWFWSFQDGGKRVAAREEMLHGPAHTYYELWDVRSGRRVADYRPDYDESSQTESRSNEPVWVKVLDVAQPTGQ